jgi:stearoyl-CoA desaturase (delta-9 desaturase)
MWALGFGLAVGFLAAGLHAVMYVMLAGAINAVGHKFGKQPYANSATNMQALALVTGGEGLHNNHHAAPTSARFSLARGELDPGWWLVRALVALRLAHARHDDVRLKSQAA